jgi:hypothetical protein
MKTFNIISLENGTIYDTIKAADHTAAFNKCLEDGFNVYDDYFLEEPKETNQRNKNNLKGRTLYIDRLF